MGLIKLLLKVILVPIVIVAVIIAAIVICIKIHRDRKKEEKRAKRAQQQRAFELPPQSQWVYPDPQALQSPLQKPSPVAYPIYAPSYLEAGIVRQQ
ncbi:hypothetical protein N7493_002547 [Penicillium malachiteum]|uniref:Uncharacterized protein n=1 Tax=Penicillium malachiteum TaxID=1324776 RepID=A0AAD6HSL6_9EURO|nr:hypothetical protein N7493_002547 [Penicillium malachiteum]